MENQELKLNTTKNISKSIVEQDYINTAQMARSLGYKKHPEQALIEEIIDFCQQNSIEVVQTETFINKNKLFFKSSDVDTFHEKYISADMLVKKCGITYRELYYIRNFGLYKNIDTIKIGRKIFHPRKEILDAIEIRKNLETDKFISSEEVRERLGIADSHLLSTLREEEGLQYYSFGHGRYHRKYYLKKDIEKLEKKQQEYKDKYYSSEQVIDLIGYRPPSHFIQPAPIQLTILLKAAVRYEGSQTVTFFHKKDIDEYVKRKKRKNYKSQLVSDDGLSSYNLLCTAENIYFSDKSKETMKAWEDFAEMQFKNSSRNAKSSRDHINTIFNCKKVLVKYLNEKELSNCTANDINTHIFNTDIQVIVRQKLYSFFRDYHKKQIALGKNVYTLKHLINPYKTSTKDSPKKDIYDFKEYQELLSYVADVEKHKSKAIDDAIKKINLQKSVHYASMWLYTLVHLNNAWRAMDFITSLPRIEQGFLERLGIHSLEEFKTKDLKFEEAKQVVYQYQIKEYLMNKNRSLNNFYCSELLTVAFATSAIICTLVANELYPEIEYINVNNSETEKDQLFYFNTNHSKPLRTAYNGFFNSFTYKNTIKFESKKMNRSLLVFMYLILSKSGNSSQALEVSKRLRSHYDYETTNIYLTIPDEELDFLVDHLFRRGSFGYIPKLLSKIVLSKEQDNDFQKETEQIKAIKSVFNGVQGIEATSGFINHLISEKISVADKILSLNRKEASKLLFEINTNIIPSRQENIMCLNGKDGCVKPNKDDKNGPCHGCPYAIPNFYSIVSLVNRIIETLKEFKETFEDAEGYEFERRKIVNHLYIYLDEFLSAKEEFGDIVYEFFEGGKKEYNDYLDLIDLVNFGDKPIEYYLSYEPKYV
ncbi:hypothetical protein [Niallia sp. MER 6]|uniref:hypothetical protein n=1 Tax=Niallia sp. MER 6 TaxID=2939567 RepID=UPI00203C3492|nr:hypothetical protein [Niallia sp. MER 6]MCM3031401.1 hypothetical protein [Niallia sp. MER 6]